MDRNDLELDGDDDDWLIVMNVMNDGCLRSLW